MELDILVTLLKTDADLDDTWAFDGSKVIFYNNRKEEIGEATHDIDAFGYDTGYISITGCLCHDDYNGFEDWLTAEQVYGRWIDYVMGEC